MLGMSIQKLFTHLDGVTEKKIHRENQILQKGHIMQILNMIALLMMKHSLKNLLPLFIQM